MPTQHLAADEPFFREWRNSLPHERRSRSRAARLQHLLGISQCHIPVLAVVGSKGKGTMAAYTSATLAAAGLRVGTLTSPSLRTNRERIRVDGAAISLADYERLAQRLADLLPELGETTVDGGYLAPTGLFTLAAVAHFAASGCEVVVLEAGMGGRSDEISLFPAEVVLVGAIFGEHLGKLGASVEKIAEEKCGVIHPRTRRVVSFAQSSEVQPVLERAAGDRLAWLEQDQVVASMIEHAALPAGLSARNARLGIKGALEYLALCSRTRPEPGALRKVTATLRSPGRLSLHRDEEVSWLVDAAIDGAGVRAALEECRARQFHPATILLSLPDDKDLAGAQAALAGHEYLPVSVEAPHLHYSSDRWPRPLVPFSKLALPALGQRVLALGTMSFVGAVLELLDVETETLFTPLPPTAAAAPAPTPLHSPRRVDRSQTSAETLPGSL